jgi:hypothetical protein
MTLYELSDKVKGFILDAQERAADGITIGDFAEIAIDLLRIVIATLDTIPATNAEKKAWAVAAVAMLFDELADKCVPVVVWPVWMIVRPAARQLLILAAGGLIEGLLPIVRAAA